MILTLPCGCIAEPIAVYDGERVVDFLMNGRTIIVDDEENQQVGFFQFSEDEHIIKAVAGNSDDLDQLTTGELEVFTIQNTFDKYHENGCTFSMGNIDIDLNFDGGVQFMCHGNHFHPHAV